MPLSEMTTIAVLFTTATQPAVQGLSPLHRLPLHGLNISQPAAICPRFMAPMPRCVVVLAAMFDTLKGASFYWVPISRY